MARYPRDSTPALNDDLIKSLSSALKNGVYVETAAALCRISKDTFYRWLRQAESEESTPLLRKLSDAVKRAMAEAEVRDLEVIDKAAQDGIWQAAAWRLERKHPDRWGRQAKVQLEHSGPDGKPIELANRTESLKRILTDPEALRAIETLEARISHDAEIES